MIEVEVGDTVVEFPDGTAPDIMKSALQKRFGAPSVPAGQSRAVKPTTGGQAFGRGLMQGATFNFYDELSGLARAGGLEPDDPDVANAIKSLFVGAYRKFKGDTDAEALYQEERNKQREIGKRLQEEHPGTSLAGNVVGAVAVPIGGMAGAATLPARMGRGAVTGAGVGAAAGFGEGEGLGGSAAQAAMGGLVGFGVGGVAPAAVEGVLRGGRAISQGVRSGVRGAISPEAEASRRVATAVERDIASDPAATTRLTPQEFTASRQAGGPATLMDLGGETTRALARSAANTSPEGRAALTGATSARFEGQAGRLTDWLRHTFHFPNAEATQQALESTARTANRAAYRRAYHEGADGLWSPELERLAGSDAVSSAMQRATKSAADEAIISGHGAMNPRITFSPDGRMQFNRAPNGMPTYPDLQYWDLVRRELSDAAIRAGRGTTEARRLNNFARAMNEELDRLVPSYQQARQGAAAFFGAENSLEAGQRFVTQNFANSETRRALASMSQTERQLFQDGFVSRLIETIEKVPDRRNVVNTIWNNPANREKITIALGRQRAAELEAGLRVEGIMDFARTAVQGNSTTARQLFERGMAGGGLGIGGVGAYNFDPTQMGVAAFMGAIAMGSRRIDQRVAQSVARMLVSDDPAILARGVGIIARSEQMMEALRRADRQLVALGGQQSAKVPQIGSVASGTEENEPAAPR